MVAQPGDIDPRKVGKQLAAPVFPVAVPRTQQRRAEKPHHREAVAPFLRGRGIQAHVVVPVAIAQQKVHLLQGQFRRFALFVRPAHGAALDEYLALRKQPVGRGIVVALVFSEREPCNIDTAICRAADIQFGSFDIQLLEPAVEQRARRKCHHHPWQAQCGAARCIQQRHI